MKALITIAIMVGLLTVAGLAIAQPSEESSVENTGSSCGSGCTQETCTAESNCGLPSCGVAQGSNCGCGGR